MCIIVIKKVGISMPSNELLSNCWENNPDGAGYMYSHAGQVYIRKGFMTIESLLDSLSSWSKKFDAMKTPLVVHFRIGTSGGNVPKNTHPFPISSNMKELEKLKSTTHLGMAHNGVISIYPQKGTSDTMTWIVEQVSMLEVLNANFYQLREGQDLMESITGSKLVFLNNRSQLFTVGEFIEKNGLLFSNGNYEKKTWSYPVGKYLQYADDDDDDVGKHLTKRIFTTETTITDEDTYFEMLSPLPLNAFIMIDDEYATNDGSYWIDADSNIYTAILYGLMREVDGVAFDENGVLVEYDENKGILKEIQDGI